MLETSRLVIRPANTSDAQDLFALNTDPDVLKYTGDSSFASPQDAEKFIRDRMAVQFDKNGMSRFMVFERDGTFLGWCGLKHFPETDEVDLGYRFRKEHWGRGYATEASKACLKYGFEILKLNRIIAKVMPENISSLKVVQKLGMTFKGYIADPTDPCPFLLYELKETEYKTCVV
jgi:[ribosomal protein S5]-alanine N-acetyltransferase